MSQPLVSVLVVTYNQADFVSEALTSVLEQDYENLEIVVTDDASTDGTPEVIRQVDRRYPGRMILMLGGPHVGMTANANRGLEACKGKYLAVQSGDDVYLAGKISSQVEWFEGHGSREVCGHDVEEFESATGRSLFLHSDLHPLKGGNDMGWILRGLPYCGVASMFRRSALPRRGFDSRLRFVIDWKLIIDMIADGGTYGYVDGVLARRRRHAGNMTNRRTVPQMRAKMDDVLEMLRLVAEEHPALQGACAMARAREFCKFGTWNLLLGRDRGSSLQFYAKSFVASRGRFWKAYAGMVLSLMPWPVVARVLEGMRRRKGALEGSS